MFRRVSIHPCMPSWNSYIHGARALARKCFYSSDSERVGLSYTVHGAEESTSTLSPVLMTHGLLGSRQNWKSIAKTIARVTKRKVITFDARNHGESPHVPQHTYEAMAQDLLKLVDDLQFPTVSILGHSMSGRTVMTFGLGNPSRLEKLIVVDVSPLSMPGELEAMRGFMEIMQSIQLDSTLTLSEGRKLADEKLKSVASDPELRAFLLTNLTKTDSAGFYWKPNLSALLANLDELKKFPPTLLSSKYDGPILFIRGGKSSYIPESDYPGIQAIFPQATFATMPGSGHWPYADNPTEFIKILVLFLSP